MQKTLICLFESFDNAFFFFLFFFSLQSNWSRHNVLYKKQKQPYDNFQGENKKPPLFVYVLQYILYRAMLSDKLQSSLPPNSCSINLQFHEIQMQDEVFKPYIQEIKKKKNSITSKYHYL